MNELEICIKVKSFTPNMRRNIFFFLWANLKVWNFNFKDNATYRTLYLIYQLLRKLPITNPLLEARSCLPDLPKSCKIPTTYISYQLHPN